MSIVTRHHIPAIIVIVISLVIMATDIFLPSFPNIAKEFKVTDNDVQLYLTVFVLASIFSALIVGPISDHYGRRKSILFGIIMFIIATLLCAIANNHIQMLIFRALQGFSAGFAGTVGAAAIQDIYNRKEATKVRAYMGISISISPIIGPLAGGFIEQHLNWRYGFLILSFAAILLFAYAWIHFFETLRYNIAKDRIEDHNIKKASLNHKAILNTYRKVLSSPSCLLYSATAPFFNIGALATLSVAPFYYQKVMGISPQKFGFLISLSVIGYVLGSAVVPKLVDKFRLIHIILAGVIIGILAMVAHVIVALTIPNSPYLVTFIQAFYLFGFAMTFGPSMTKAMDFFPENRGTTSSIANTFRQIFTFIGTIVAYFSNEESFAGAASITVIVMSLLLGLLVVQYTRESSSDK